MAKLTTAYIGLGSNLGDRRRYIEKALKILGQTSGIKVLRVSRLAETDPIAGIGRFKYLNAVAQIVTGLKPENLLSEMSRIEAGLGRSRKTKWSDRTIDLDMLLFGQHVLKNDNLTIPHPQMHLRSFVLEGLQQIAPNLVHPVLREPIVALASRLGGRDFMLDSSRPQLVSIAGVIGVGKTTLAEKISRLLGVEKIFEPYDKNPFLSQVYAGRKDMALNCQLHFLTSRMTQLACGALQNGKIAVSDYIFNQELIYAKHLLNGRQLPIYSSLYRRFAGSVSQPVLVIYLKDSIRNCMDRIRSRNRPYEHVIKPQFLKDLSEHYERLFSHWNICPLIRISMLKFDCTKDKNIRYLADQIRSYTAIK